MVSANHVDRIRNVIECQRKSMTLVCHGPPCSDHWSTKATCFRTESHAIVGPSRADAIAKGVKHDVYGAALCPKVKAPDHCSQSKSSGFDDVFHYVSFHLGMCL